MTASEPKSLQVFQTNQIFQFLSENIGKELGQEERRSEIVGLQGVITSSQGQMLLAMLLMGKWLDDEVAAAEESGAKYGQNVVGQVVDSIREFTGQKVSASTLYERRNAYLEMITEKKTLRGIAEWINQQYKVHGKVTWTMVQETFLDRLKADDRYGSEENASNVLIAKAERSGQDLEKVADLALQGDEEALGAMQAAQQTWESIKARRKRVRELSKEEWEDPEYVEWIHSQLCPITKSPEVEGAHIWSGVVGKKKSDLVRIPLHYDLHRNEFHRLGIDSFAKQYGRYFGEKEINWYRLAFNYLHKYITGQPFDLDI